MEPATKNLAVFIDFENCARAPAFDLNILMSRLKERGRLLIRRAYGDWGRFASQKRALAEASVSLIELPSHGGKGKNSSDIALVVDALEATMNRPHIDTLVVISGDSDYTPLFSKVRELGKYVIVVGPKNGTSSFVKDYCDELLFFCSLAGKTTADKVAAKESYPLLASALRAILDDGREPRLSTIKNRMKQLDSSFDESNYGFGKFSKYIVRAERDGVIGIVRTAANEWIVTDIDDGEPTDEHHQPRCSKPAPPKAARPDASPTQAQRLMTVLRKQGMVCLGADRQREVVERICEAVAEATYPIAYKDLGNLVVDRFGQEIDGGLLSKTKVRGVLRILVHSDAFATNRVGDGEQAHCELTLMVPPGDHQAMLLAHDGCLVETARSQGLALDIDGWTTLLVSATWPSLVGV